MKTSYNKTQLNPQKIFEKGIYHRDYFAHYLRWSFVLKLAKRELKILDLGCGSGNMFEVFYRNRYKPARYLGIDIRQRTIEKNIGKYLKTVAEFKTDDLVMTKNYYGNDWDLITCFEVAEHVGHENIDKLLTNIKRWMGPETLLLISTPCYDPDTGAAKNHMIDDKVGEFTFEEFKTLLSKYFKIEKVVGTFASKKDYIDKLTPGEKEVYEKLDQYFDNNLMSVIMAPLVPEHSRNCMWICSISGGVVNGQDNNKQ